MAMIISDHFAGINPLNVVFDIFAEPPGARSSDVMAKQPAPLAAPTPNAPT